MKLYRISVLAALSLAALSCSTKVVQGDGGNEGFVNFTVENGGEIVEVTKSNVSDYTSLPSVSDFRIVVKNSDGAPVYDGLVSGWTSSTALMVGNYSVDASYGEEGAEGFDKPYFAGSASFAVTGGQTTAVSVPVKLGNSIVKISCSESFRNYFPQWAFKVTTGTGTVIDFPSTETRAAFVDAYKFTVSGTFTSQGGAVKTFSNDYNGIEAATCYTMKFDASNIGGLKVTVTFDDTVTTVDCGDVELND